MKIAIFYSRLFQNTHQNASIINVFKKNFHENCPIANVYLKYYFFYIKIAIFKNFIIIKNSNFRNFLKTKSDPHIHQIAPFKKKISGKHAPKPP